MWIFTQDGFISAVDNNQRSGLLTARARDRQSLALLAEISGSRIEFTPHRDYQYRVYVTRDQLNEFLTAQVDTLDYGNFKDRLKTTRGYEFARAAGEVWVAMNEVADDEARDWYADRRAARKKSGV